MDAARVTSGGVAGEEGQVSMSSGYDEECGEYSSSTAFQ